MLMLAGLHGSSDSSWPASPAQACDYQVRARRVSVGEGGWATFLRELLGALAVLRSPALAACVFPPAALRSLFLALASALLDSSLALL